jgi:hypothetical protein
MHDPCDIQFLSEPQQVSMGDEWFDITPLNHFWIERRFRVFEKFAGVHIKPDSKIAEIGCGHGVVQLQVEKKFSKMVDGFELNVSALKKSLATKHHKYVYDIHDRNHEFQFKYDILFLFDVLEHIEKVSEFLNSAAFHLKSGGIMVVNVPALQTAYSRYDLAVGHLRRYSLIELKKLAFISNLEYVKGTYWGANLLPILFFRKIILSKSKNDNNEIIRIGMKPPFPLFNRLLHTITGLEIIPQTILGSSAMCIFRKKN